jgi:hypothetical protein
MFSFKRMSGAKPQVSFAQHFSFPIEKRGVTQGVALPVEKASRVRSERLLRAVRRLEVLRAALSQE